MKYQSIVGLLAVFTLFSFVRETEAGIVIAPSTWEVQGMINDEESGANASKAAYNTLVASGIIEFIERGIEIYEWAKDDYDDPIFVGQDFTDAETIRTCASLMAGALDNYQAAEYAYDQAKNDAQDYLDFIYSPWWSNPNWEADSYDWDAMNAKIQALQAAEAALASAIAALQSDCAGSDWHDPWPTSSFSNWDDALDWAEGEMENAQ